MAESSGSLPMSPTAPSRRALAVLVVLLQLAVIVLGVFTNAALASKFAALFRQAGGSSWFFWMFPAHLIVIGLLLVAVILLIVRANARAVATYLVASLVGLPFWGMEILGGLLRAHRYPRSSGRHLALGVIIIVLSIGEYLYLRRLAKSGDLR